jgi:hypothetical protein
MANHLTSPYVRKRTVPPCLQAYDDGNVILKGANMEPVNQKSVINRSSQERRKPEKVDPPYLTDEKAIFMDRRSGKDRRTDLRQSALTHDLFSG